MRWRVRLGEGKPAKLVVIYAVATVGAVFGILEFRSALMGLLAFAMILGSTAEYWLGCSYKVDERQATARVGPSLTAMEWQNVRRVVIGPTSVKLSPLEHKTAMDPYRGVLIRTLPVNHAEVLEFVRSHAPETATYEEAS